MNPDWKNSTKSGLIGIAIGGVLVLPYFIWHSFWCLGIGLIIAVLSFLYLVCSIFKHYDDDAFLGTGIFLGVFLSFLCLFWHDERYITPSGSKQHIYDDCRTLNRSSNIKLVTEAEGFFHLKFSDCKVCEERKRKEAEIRRQGRIEAKRRELREYLQEFINRLDAGEDPDIIKKELSDDWSRDEETYDDFVPGVPSRYQ